jgi:hypothetical protein
MTRMLPSALASETWARKFSVRSFRSSLLRIAHGRGSLPVSSDDAVSSTSHGSDAVSRSSSITISLVPPRNGSISTGTSRSNSVRPICGSRLASFDALATSSRTSKVCVCWARTSVRARLVSSV